MVAPMIAGDKTYAELEAEVARLAEQLRQANAYIERLQATVNDLVRDDDAGSVAREPSMAALRAQEEFIRRWAPPSSDASRDEWIPCLCSLVQLAAAPSKVTP